MLDILKKTRDLHEIIARNIRYFRNDVRGIKTIAEASRQGGWKHSTTWNGIEKQIEQKQTGKPPLPALETLEKIAKTLDIPLHKFFEEDPKPVEVEKEHDLHECYRRIGEAAFRYQDIEEKLKEEIRRTESSNPRKIGHESSQLKDKKS